MYFILIGKAVNVWYFVAFVFALFMTALILIAKSKSKRGEVVCFMAYCAVLLIATLTPVGRIVGDSVKIFDYGQSLNLELDFVRPFQSWQFFLDFLINAAMFMPFGFLLADLLGNRIIITVLICLGWSVVTELLQIKIVSRVADVNDVVFNALGGLVGALASKIFVKSRFLAMTNRQRGKQSH